jgi:hypothetical protein
VKQQRLGGKPVNSTRNRRKWWIVSGWTSFGKLLESIVHDNEEPCVRKRNGRRHSVGFQTASSYAVRSTSANVDFSFISGVIIASGSSSDASSRKILAKYRPGIRATNKNKTASGYPNL